MRSIRPFLFRVKSNCPPHFCDGSNMNIPSVNRNYARSIQHNIWMELHMQLCYMQMTAKQCVHACIYRKTFDGWRWLSVWLSTSTHNELRRAVRTQIIHSIIIINSELIQWVHKLVHPTGELGIYTWAVSNMNNARPFCVHSSIVSYNHRTRIRTSSQFAFRSASSVRLSHHSHATNRSAHRLQITRITSHLTTRL